MVGIPIPRTIQRTAVSSKIKGVLPLDICIIKVDISNDKPVWSKTPIISPIAAESIMIPYMESAISLVTSFTVGNFKKC